MSILICSAALLVAVTLSLYFSTLTYALRDFSHSKLADWLGKHDADKWFETLTEKTEQYVLATAVCRMIASLLIWVSVFGLLSGQEKVEWYGETVFLSALVTLVSSIIAPHALAKYLAEQFIGVSAPLLSAIRMALWPLVATTTLLDETMKRLLGVKDETEEQQIENEIMSVVEEGEKEGVVDEQERELIENVIEFRETTAHHIMTPRSEIAALDHKAGLDEARALIDSSGHSRLPVYEETLDRVIGILHARDLIRWLGQAEGTFELASIIRPVMHVPETKELRHLLDDFRNQKIQMAIVLDEYGGTAGLVTIEDILEELVGEITDEHEPSEPAMFRRISENAAEVDARLPVSQLNEQLGLSIPEDAGFETVGGYLMSALGLIPQTGAVHELGGTRFVILDAEPSKVNRVRVEAAASQKTATKIA